MRKTAINVCITTLALIGCVNALISDFELDGNAIVDNPTKRDWANAAGNGLVFTGIIDDPAPQSTFTTGGSKDTNDITQWRHRDTSVPDKDDLTHAFAYGEQHADKLYVYFGTDRFANDGDASIGFWFFQDDVHVLNNGRFTGQHKDGDVLVIGNYGSTQEIQVYRWQAGSLALELSNAAAECNSTINQTVCAITNTAPTPSPWPYTAKTGEVNQFPTHSFLEGGLNMRDIFASETVPCFTSFLSVSRSSSSTIAQLKDFVLGRFDICDLKVSVDCTDVALSQDHTQLVYNYSITVENTGFGTLYNVELYYNDLVVTSYPQMESGVVQTYRGTFTSSSLNQSTETVRVRGTKVQTPTSESDYIDHTAVGAECPILLLAPNININGSCTVGLVLENDRLSVQVNYGGQVCNTGDIALNNVVVTNARNTDVVNLGSLVYGSCAGYTGSFYPTGNYNNTVWVTSTSALGGLTVIDSTSFNCQLCPTF